MNSAGLSRYGAAAYIVAASAVWFAGAGLATLTWPDALTIPLPFWILFGIAGLFLGGGLALLSRALKELHRAKVRDAPARYGTYSLCRHPVYASWILFLLPAIAILTGSWPMLGLPLAGWLGYKAAISREEKELEVRYGGTYTDYCAKTRELLPLPPKDRKR
jgi:protein-S-isoprenylcysteine O-methyltransferase Ste14